MNLNLLEVFDSNVRKFGTKDFIRYNGEGQTYQKVQQISLQIANLLRDNNIGEGDKIALFCYNSHSFVWFLLGAWRVGAAIVPVNHKLKTKELDYILSDSDAKLLLFDAQLADVVTELDSDVIKISTQGKVDGYFEIESIVDSQEPMDINDGVELTYESIAEILYTSGTTGFPKGCVMPHFSVFVAAQIAAVGVSMVREERLLLAMPIWHSSPLNNWFGGTMYIGGTVVMLREYHPLHFLQIIPKEQITLYFGAPVSYSMPMKMIPNFSDYDLSSVRVWTYGGGPISEDLSRKISAAYKSTNFFQVFGMTETGPTGMVLYPDEQLAKAGSIGKYPLPSVSIKVVDEAGNELPNGSIGEIWMKAYSCMTEYYKKPEATRDVFTADGWYKTGDIALKDEDGYLYIVDRKKDIINSGGENVYSKQVEDALMLHPHVQDAAVIGTPHDEWGETVTAVLVLGEDQELTLDDLREFLKPHLAGYRIPKIVHFTDVLPRNPSGKVQKFILKEQFTGK